MEQQALIDSFVDFKDEKNIDRVTLMAILEESIRHVMKKKYGTDDNIDIIVNPDKGDLEIWRNRTVVEDGEVENPNAEIALCEAREIESDFEVGEEVSEEIELAELGRRAILSLRQNLASKIQEHDNTMTYKKFKDRIGEITSGEVNYIRHRHAILINDDQSEMVLPSDQQIPTDFFRKGDTVRAVIKDVEIKGNNRPIIILSRTAPEFLEKLFEQEIPEVLDGLITVKSVVRSPGDKAKVAVESYDDRIDPVGACVGMRGSRIHGIVRELNNENIDVINYTNNKRLYIQRSLSPAKITSIDLDEENRVANIYLDAGEVSKAIGKNGHNIRLASKLTNCELNVFRNQEEEDVDLGEFSDEIDQWIIDEFKAIGCDTAKSILDLPVADLVKRTDLEEETIVEVRTILASEFE